MGSFQETYIDPMTLDFAINFTCQKKHVHFYLVLGQSRCQNLRLITFYTCATHQEAETSASSSFT